MTSTSRRSWRCPPGGALRSRGEYREARALQLKRLEEANRRLEAAIRRSGNAVMAEQMRVVLSSSGEIGREGWEALSVQAKRDIMDVVADRVIVYAKEEPRNRWAGPHKIKVVWR